jgi:nuclear transport factor 2 (NTF2) superfamily protein
MWYPVTVACRNITEVTERQEWAEEQGMKLLNKTWAVVGQQQCVTFHFDRKEDALFFMLRWS